jgi:hypothetical protein
LAIASRDPEPDKTYPMSAILITETLPAPGMTVTPRIKAAAFAFRFSFLAPGHPAIKNPDRTTVRFTNLDTLRYRVASALGAAELKVANQSRSHPPMSMTWNLVSDRARRIPTRFFKIHKRKARATSFKRPATTEEGGTCAETLSISEIFSPTC